MCSFDRVCVTFITIRFNIFFKLNLNAGEIHLPSMRHHLCKSLPWTFGDFFVLEEIDHFWREQRVSSSFRVQFAIPLVPLLCVLGIPCLPKSTSNLKFNNCPRGTAPHNLFWRLGVTCLNDQPCVTLWLVQTWRRSVKFHTVNHVKSEKLTCMGQSNHTKAHKNHKKISIEMNFIGLQALESMLSVLPKLVEISSNRVLISVAWPISKKILSKLTTRLLYLKLSLQLWHNDNPSRTPFLISKLAFKWSLKEFYS